MSQTSSGPGVAELQDELHSLRTLLSASLILMIVFITVINFFLLKQVSTLRAQAELLDTESNTFNSAKAVDYWNHLVVYARTHPDFAPVVNKFGPYLNETLLGNNLPKQ